MGLDRLLESLKRSKKSGKLSSIVMVAGATNWQEIHESIQANENVQ